jgi:two-component sensor histidine kinase
VLKRTINSILALGSSEDQSLHLARMVRTTNLLNLLVVTFVTSSFSTAIFLKSRYDLFPILTVFLFAGFSFFLNARKHHHSAFLFFAFYINLAICYFSLSHPPETDMFVYFFPVIVSLILLNTAALTNYSLVWSAFICAFFLSASFVIEIPAIQLELDPQQSKYLQRFNVIGASLITAVLSYLLSRIITRQFNEISAQNTDLIKTKEEVKNSLREKEVLLAELHHRVKNNLAIISGLLNLQDDATSNTEAKEVIRDSKSRIMSMALVHRMLYEKSELKNLEIKRYTEELIAELFNSYDLNGQVKIELQSDKIVLPVNKSVPLGLIINEIVTNSIKYAFKWKNRNSGTFMVEVRAENQSVHMVLKDGQGFPANFDANSDQVSLGIFLIKSLTEQIDGTVRFSNQEGARIDIHFSLT